MNSFWRDALNAARIALTLMGFGAVVLKGGDFAFRYVFLDLQSVDIADHYVGDDPEVIAFRHIVTGGWRYWTVTVRRAGSDEFIGFFRHPPINYKAKANQKNPLDMPLSQWIGVDGAIRKLESNRQYGAGIYYANTCHHQLIWKRCVRSSPYIRYSKTEHILRDEQ